MATAHTCNRDHESFPLLSLSRMGSLSSRNQTTDGPDHGLVSTW